MSKTPFKLPDNLLFNRGAIENPSAYFNNREAKSWLLLTGEEFAAMPGGISYTQVKEATPHSVNVVSDPPKTLNLELARQHIKALDELPRPTLISCRTGPRAAAVAYMYAGLKKSAEPEDVLAAAEEDQAPFINSEEYKERSEERRVGKECRSRKAQHN